MFHLIKSNRKLLIIPLFILIALFIFNFSVKLVSSADKTNFLLSAPRQILTNSKTNFLFILNQRSNEITVLNGREDKLIVNLPIGGKNPIIVKADGNGNLYVLNKDSNSLTIFPSLLSKKDFDQNSFTQIIKERKIIPTFQTPGAFALDEELQKIYIINQAVDNLLIYEQKINKFSSRETGGGPTKILVNPQTHKVYITNTLDRTLSIFDGRTNDLIKTIEIGRPIYNISLSSENKIFISSQRDNFILVIDGETDELIKKIEKGLDGPGRMVINPLNKKLYVVNRQSALITVVDLKDYSFYKEIPLPAGSLPASLSIDVNSNLIFVSNQGKSSISVIDGSKDSLITTVKTKSNPGRPVINSLLEKVYVPHTFSNAITVINIRNNFEAKTIENTDLSERTFALPLKLALNEKDNEIYVLNNISESFTIIDGENLSIKKKVSVGSNPQKIIFVPDLNKILVLNNNGNSLTIYNINDKSTQEIFVGKGPIDLLFNSKTNKIYTLNYISQDLSVVDSLKEVHLRDIPLETRPQAMSLNLNKNKIYLTSPPSKEVIVINGATNEVSNRIKLESEPDNILYDENSNKIYVASKTDNSLTIIDGDSEQILKNLKVGLLPIYLTSSEGKVYVSLSGGNRIRVIDSDSLKILPSDIKTAMNPTKIIIDGKNKKLFVLSRKGNLDIIKLKNNKLSASLNIYRDSGFSENISGGALTDMAYNPETKKLFVAMAGVNAVAVVNTAAERLEKVITNEGIEVIEGPSFKDQTSRFLKQYGVLILLLIIFSYLVYRFRDKIFKYLALKKK
jgi:DNA-binding beta-propeller fold protein YncE